MKSLIRAAACVSMITHISTMLTTFDDGTLDLVFCKWMLGLLGGAVSAFIIGMAIYMIVQSTKKMESLKAEDTDE